MRQRKNSGKSVRNVPEQYDMCGEVVQEMAKELIANYHSHLALAKIAYLYSNKEKKSKGKVTFAEARKVGKIARALCDYDFVIVIYHPTWVNLSDEDQRIVLDHELCHLLIEEDENTGEAKYKILPHDFEEFGDIIKRYGNKGHLSRLVELACNSVKEKESSEDFVDVDDY